MSRAGSLARDASPRPRSLACHRQAARADSKRHLFEFRIMGEPIDLPIWAYSRYPSVLELRSRAYSMAAHSRRKQSLLFLRSKRGLSVRGTRRRGYLAYAFRLRLAHDQALVGVAKHRVQDLSHGAERGRPCRHPSSLAANLTRSRRDFD